MWGTYAMEADIHGVFTPWTATIIDQHDRETEWLTVIGRDGESYSNDFDVCRESF